MKFKTAKFQQQFHWWLMVVVLTLATAACEKKEPPPKEAAPETAQKTAVQQVVTLAVTLVPCGSCCSLDPAAYKPEITAFQAMDAGNNKVLITAATAGTEDLPCIPGSPAKKLAPGVGHYLAVVVDDKPGMATSYDQQYATRNYEGTLTTGAAPKVARGYLVFNPAANYQVCMKYPGAAVAYSFANGAWTKNTDTPMVILNLPEDKAAGPYPAASVPLDFVLNNAPLGANYKLHVTIQGLDTTIAEDKPFHITGLAPGEYTVTVQLQKPKTGGGWEDVPSEFAHSTRTFRVRQ
ncbi:MAG: hypothetical protein IT211_14350 [Armatimonadetes bacterium]|nr:hypothetical protein [Armatimonadota bacterium]